MRLWVGEIDLILFIAVAIKSRARAPPSLADAISASDHDTASENRRLGMCMSNVHRKCLHRSRQAGRLSEISWAVMKQAC